MFIRNSYWSYKEIFYHLLQEPLSKTKFLTGIINDWALRILIFIKNKFLKGVGNEKWKRISHFEIDKE